MGRQKAIKKAPRRARATCAKRPGTGRAADQAAKDRFLKALRETGIVRAACEATDTPRGTVYGWRNRDPAFKAAYAEAVRESTELIERTVFEAATVGVPEVIVHNGQISMIGFTEDGATCPPDSPKAVRWEPLTVRKFHPTLAMFLLKARKPKKYRENVKHEHTGPNDGPILIQNDL